MIQLYRQAAPQTCMVCGVCALFAILGRYLITNACAQIVLIQRERGRVFMNVSSPPRLWLVTDKVDGGRGCTGPRLYGPALSSMFAPPRKVPSDPPDPFDWHAEDRVPKRVVRPPVQKPFSNFPKFSAMKNALAESSGPESSPFPGSTGPYLTPYEAFRARERDAVAKCIHQDIFGRAIMFRPGGLTKRRADGEPHENQERPGTPREISTASPRSRGSMRAALDATRSIRSPR